jgi:class 3 adenylate cyclase/tetratricopeptide (TPR) repeat protein
MLCPVCGAENEPGRKFCGECGASLALACPSCGTPNPPNVKFCGECGTPLAGGATGPSAAAASPAGGPASTPVAERRLVSVLFADLVGFTTLSEARDSEEVRDLLSRYFDTSRQIIGRYGGNIEKFIGDAVMAVWGAPVATENDAELAVRAGLDLAAAVAALGQEIGAPELRARAGILTGEAAVTIGAEGQGMVAGDLVNTASRIQSAAQPGEVFVGETTRRASDASIAYEDAGAHELKGKAEPVPLWRAVRVLSGRGGAQKSAGLEAPFVGRERELRLIKDLFHASVEEHKAHLVNVTGAAGIGKSRLSWEFYKYMDGLADDFRWHRGRCLSYGEGISFWALAEMVRTRCSILEGEEPASAAAKLRVAVEEAIPDPEERRWVEPRLANLLGLEERGGKDQEGLFAAWRMFYERLSDEMPTIMVFEDMQWADVALLDFVEYLLEWSRAHPLFIVALSRPELAERRPTWGTGRGVTSIYLEPLPHEAMEGVLTGLVPGLPDDLRSQILGRAEGVPLYAMETVRMLLDRGLLAQEGSVYRPTGSVETLEVPETLHALIAARLDGLTANERRLVQDAAVLGKTFTKPGIIAVTGTSEAEVEPLLASLVRKEILSLLADPMSPERGQYGFLQDLVKLVAYEMLSKKERKVRHVAAAAYIESSWGSDEDEFVEVVASHLDQAYQLAPDAEDAPELRSKARVMLERAGERAGSLAAPSEAIHYFERAADLADETSVRAELIERAGLAAREAGDIDGAIERLERAVGLFEEDGLSHPAARVSAQLGVVMWQRGRLAEAVDRMERSYEVLASDDPDEDFAALAAGLARLDFFAGRIELASERVEVAIDIAEGLWLPEVLAQALNTKALVLYSAKGRRHEAYALLRYALEVAIENDLPSATHRAMYNLADLAAQTDRYQEARDYVEQGLAFNRRLGNRTNEWQFLGQTYPHFALGEWDELLALVGDIPFEKVAEHRLAAVALILLAPLVHVHRGDLEAAESAVAAFPSVDASADVQEITTDAAGRAVMYHARGRDGEALAAAREALALLDDTGPAAEQAKEAFVAGLEAALSLDDLEAVEELLRMIEAYPPGKQPQFLQAHAMRFRARLADRRGDPADIAALFKGSAGLFREIAVPFYMAVTLLEHGEWLAREGRNDEATPLLDEAQEVFERLRAKPWLERLGQTAGAASALGGQR